MAGRAQIARHPIHPMFVVFPIALWIFAFVCDLAFHWGSMNPFWKDVAYYAMLGGVIGALAAAIPGLIDYGSLREPRAKRVATAHLVLNLTIVVLYVANLWVRTRTAPDATGPVWLSLASLILLVVAGWLGGELVYVHGVAVEPRRAGAIDVTTGRPVEAPTSADYRRPA